jgi:TRAP-type uncharacterized transport system fused permease subunit
VTANVVLVVVVVVLVHKQTDRQTNKTLSILVLLFSNLYSSDSDVVANNE